MPTQPVVATRSSVSIRGNVLGHVLPARFIMALLGCWGMGIIYGLKVNLSVAIVSMVNHSAVHDEEEGEQRDATEDGPFVWSTRMQGFVKGAYFVGYMISQIPGGKLAHNFSAKWVLFSSMTINIITTLCTPIGSKLHVFVAIGLRVIAGLGSGMSFPAMHVLLANWAPVQERCTITSICYAGCALGTVAFMYFTGLICHKMNWEWSFYIEGATSSVWLIVWAFLIADDPKHQIYINKSERDMIITMHPSVFMTDRHVHAAVPWKHVMKSKPFWAILVCHLTFNWGFYMLLIELPLYMKEGLKYKMSENAFMTALPFLMMWVFSLVLGFTLDRLKKKTKMSQTISTKIGTFCCTIVPAVCFVGLCFSGSSREVSVVLMTVAVTGVGGMYTGFLSNHIDISANHAGSLMAITNTIGTVPGFLVPAFVGEMTRYDTSITSWRKIFITAIIGFLFGGIFYIIFASGKEQYWNRIENLNKRNVPPRDDDDEMEVRVVNPLK